MYEASLNREWLEWANALQDKQDELFWDDNRNSYYTSALGDSSVLLRLVEGEFYLNMNVQNIITYSIPTEACCLQYLNKT